MSPHAVPVGWRRGGDEYLHAIMEYERRSVIRLARETLGETHRRSLPILGAISGQSCGENLMQLAQLRRAFARAADKLVDAYRLTLAGDDQKIQLARLYRILRKSVRGFLDDNLRAVGFVDAFEPRCDVHHIADHRV